MPKIKFGVTIDEELRKELDRIVGESEDLDLSRSEVADTILGRKYDSSVFSRKWYKQFREIIAKCIVRNLDRAI